MGLLAAHGLIGLQDLERDELVPSQVLEAADRNTLPFNRFYISPSYGTPYQQRRFKRSIVDIKKLSESVLPSRAIRFIRNAVASLDFGIQLKKVARKDKQEQKRLSPLIDQVTAILDNPNTNDDDMPTFVSQVVEDILAFDAGAWEYVEKPRYIPNNQTLAMEVVPGYSLAHNVKWDGDPKAPRWVQVQDDGQLGQQLLDKDIEYVSMRKRSWTPFGLSPLETVIDVMDAWLGLASYQRRVASDAYPPILVTFGGQVTQDQILQLRSYWENELKGRGTPGLLGGFDDSKVLDLKAGGDDRLMLAYQEMLVRTISFAFDLKPLDFSIERDVNRTTAEVQRISSLRDGPKVLARQISAKFNQRVLPRISQILKNPEVLKLEFFWLNIDPADDKQQAEVFEILTKAEILLPDEARIELDYEPRQDGLGMLSPNALKQLYSINPLAGQGKQNGKSLRQFLPEIEEPEPKTEDNLEQIAAADQY